MNITRDNYEEFFMLYADNELSAAERKEVEAFVAANPGMHDELALFQQFKLNPDEAVVYAGKELLMKSEAGETISLANYETFFVLYADDELANHEKAAVEDFVYHHPQLQSSFELMQQVKLSPDTSIAFENKESLYRKEKDDRVIPFRWWRMAAAAIILVAAGIFWLYQSKTNVPKEEFVKTNPPVTIPQPPTLHNKEVKTGNDTTGNRPAEKENLAKTDPVNNNQQVQHTPAGEKAETAVREQRKTGSENKNKEMPAPPVNEEMVARNTDNKNEGNKLTGISISSIKNESAKQAAINTDIAAAASKSVNDHQLTYLDTDEKSNNMAEQAVAVDNDQLEVLNTSVNTKNSLRGLFRKASRLIAKKTNSGEEDSKHKSILIGGFEIAVR